MATLSTFGLKRGVGVETLSAFFAPLRLATQVGCSPSMHALVKSYALPIGQRVRHAHQELTKAKEAIARRPGASSVDQPDLKAKVLVEARQVEVTRWEEAHHTSRGLLETLSLTLHPFRSSDAAPQTTTQVARQLQATVEAMEAFAQCHQLPARHDAMTKVRKQVLALAALVDF